MREDDDRGEERQQCVLIAIPMHSLLRSTVAAASLGSLPVRMAHAVASAATAAVEAHEARSFGV